MQRRNSVLCVLRGDVSLWIPARWIRHHFSFVKSAKSQRNTNLFPTQLHSSSFVADSLSPRTPGNTLYRDELEFVTEPIGTSQALHLGTRLRDEHNQYEKAENRLYKLLDACVDTPSTEFFENLISSTTELYKRLPSQYWLLHSRALVNYGVQSLVEQKSAEAIGLLREAIDIVTSFEGETTVLHLRVILANALACEGEIFEALCEYEKALTVMRYYPVESSLSQVVSGKEFRIPLSRNFVLEDFDRFVANEELVKCALTQGNKKLNSSLDQTERIQITWILARLQRRLGEKDASLLLYTSSLRLLLETPNTETEINVMHDIGLLLCFEIFDVAQGLPYLEAAAEMSYDTALRKLEEMKQQQQVEKSENIFSENEIYSIRRSIFTLLDAAVCLAENEEMGKSLGLFEECIALMNDCKMQKHSAWVRMKYADALCNASLIDKAIRVYLETMDILQTIEQEESLQIACMGMAVPLTIAEVESRLAHCFQIHVGEYRRACVHFCTAIRRCGIHVGCPFRVSEEKNTVDSDKADSEVVCWMLENYAKCCERVGRKDIAKEALESCVNVERTLGGYCASTLLRLAELHKETNNASKSVEIYIQLLTLPEDAIEPDALLQAAYRFASLCYGSKDEELEVALANATSVSDGKEGNSLSTVHLSDSSCHSSNNIIISSFKRSARIIMASHTVDKSKSNENSEDELKALMTLSRGGFFCQQRGDEAGAEELYHLAVDYTERANVYSEEYSRELAIMLANYATVMAHKDTERAQELYDRAVDTCPTEENVSAAAASFFVLTSNYAGGRKCIQRMIDTVTNRAVLLRLYGKLAWLGVVCWDELTPCMQQECLQHLLLALGLEANQFCLIVKNLHVVSVERTVSPEFKRQLLAGISLSVDQETVSLACYVAQTKLPYDGKFINACYKIALTRFPNSTTIIVNYAKFCADHGSVTLARKYYAAAFRYSHKDPRSSDCYADYLAFLNGESRQKREEQVVAGEGLARYQVERSGYDSSSVYHSEQSCALYGKYLASFMPSPSVPVTLFEEALKKNPADSRTTSLYGSFLWNVCLRALSDRCTREVREQIAERVESLYLKGLKHQPQSILLLTSLSALYVSMGNRFDDAVSALERARKLSPHNVVVNRLLCAAFHDECMKEEKKDSVNSKARLQTLLETTHQLYELTVQLDPLDRLTLTRYCQFAIHGLRNSALATELMQRLQRLPKA